MNTYYVRHTNSLLIDDALKHKLWAERLVAVHFPFTVADAEGMEWSDRSTWPPSDTKSVEVSEYDRSGRRAVGALRELARDGGYVCAEYAWTDEALVGYVEPGADIRLLEGKWDDGERDAVLKALPLRRAKAVPLSQQAVLLAGRPRQGTISQWLSVGSLVEDLVEGRRPEPRIGLLSPALQEAMCAEYLRTPDAEADGLPRLAALVLPVGRSLRDLDIVGVTVNNESVIAQVTHDRDSEAGGKLDRLSEAARDGDRAILFCRCDDRYEERGVTVYPIDRAFNRFLATDLGQRWFDATLHHSGFSS